MDDFDVGVKKTLCNLDGGQLFLSNTVDIKHIGFFKDILDDFDEIVYFEYDNPVCPCCGEEMGDNGSRKSQTQ